MAKATGAARTLSLNGFRLNERNRVDGVVLLAEIPDRSAALMFLDPQYRAVLDELQLGNEGKQRQVARRALTQMSDDTIALFVEEAGRILRPSGHLMLWTDKFNLAEGLHRRWLRRTRLEVVDMITWNKMRPGMGRRSRCRTEFLIVAQKPPRRAKGVWTDHGIDDCWSEHGDRSVHPHAKPHLLTERLIRATTRRGDLVVDPCAGGFGVLEACRASGRTFLGGDLDA